MNEVKRVFLRTPDGERINPERQAKKALRLSGRQLRKRRKEERRKSTLGAPRLNKHGNFVVNL